MTYDGLRDLNITYNHLGRIERVSRNDTVLVNYCYLADGTKVSALDGYGNGLLYRGSLTYRKEGNSITLESAEYDQGRIVADASGYNGYLVLIHIPDHLGNVRVVADEDCNVLERNGYYPFGLRWSVGSDLESNRYRFNGKEEQSEFGLPYIDYGARQYDPILARWSAPDPLAEKYYGISPYAFCSNNPINYVDPDGRREWPVNPQFNGFSRRHENNYRNPRPKHNGVDINIGAGNNDLGAPVYATHDGVITRYVTINDDSNAGGNRIQITSEDSKVSTYYMHLNTMSGFKVGDYVSEGTIIGTIGGLVKE